MALPTKIVEDWTSSRIAKLRERLAMTQREFGETVYADKRTVKRWEAGSTSPRPSHVSRFDELFAARLSAEDAAAVLDA